jgi:hypothetical protein
LAVGKVGCGCRFLRRRHQGFRRGFSGTATCARRFDPSNSGDVPPAPFEITGVRVGSTSSDFSCRASAASQLSIPTHGGRTMNKILTVGVALALLLGTATSPASARSGGGAGAGGAGGHGGGGHGHGGQGHGGGGGGFHADRFERRFFESGLGLSVLGGALLIAPAVYYVSPVYYAPLPTPCTLPFPPNDYPLQGYYPPQAWLEQPCQ